MPRNWAVTHGSSTTVSRSLAGLAAPSRRVARSAASAAARGDVEVARARARPRSRSRSGSRRPRSAMRVGGRRSSRSRGRPMRMPVVVATAASTRRVDVLGRLDARRCGDRRPCTARSSSRARSILRSVGNVAQRRRGRGRARRRPRRRARPARANSSGVAKPALSRASARVSASTVVVEGAGVGEALPAVDDRPGCRRPATRPTTATRPRLRRPGSRCRWPRTTTASTCSPGPARATTRSAMRRGAQASSCSCRGAADGEAATRRVGTPSPTGTPWPSLPQVPGGPMAKSLPSGVDAAEHLGAVADEVALAERLGDLAVLDEVGLGHAEHEVAGGGVDLAAAEVLRRSTPCSVPAMMSSGSSVPSSR